MSHNTDIHRHAPALERATGCDFLSNVCMAGCITYRISFGLDNAPAQSAEPVSWTTILPIR